MSYEKRVAVEFSAAEHVCIAAASIAAAISL